VVIGGLLACRPSFVLHSGNELDCDAVPSRPLPIQLEVFFSSRPTQLPQTSHANPRTEAQKCFSSYCYSE
jgi:hypothetical protein